MTVFAQRVDQTSLDGGSPVSSVVPSGSGGGQTTSGGPK